MLAALAALGAREGLITGSARRQFTTREAAAATWSAKWELMLPAVIVGSLLAGATTVQSAALAALYTLIVQRFIQRDLAGYADLRLVSTTRLRSWAEYSSFSQSRRLIHYVPDRRASARTAG